ncbi:hypothetical protein Pla144_17470 [Bythopirellula polymerisocia]|uniref:Core-binding (CB) domain-containing protein n=1 Tax=Bythopirellula polymerisocia TaxID=2528003 RepID=A0A5C6CY30_9BACT|nr:hypothetical protein Pla144_17470 [Bythopirellula polymerisocia]
MPFGWRSRSGRCVSTTRESSPCLSPLRTSSRSTWPPRNSRQEPKEYRLTATKWTACGNGVAIGEIEQTQIRDFLDWVHEKAANDGGSYAGRTANKARVNLSAILSWAW